MRRSLALVSVNSFIEDTSVVVAVAYLFVRGRFERLLANPMLSGSLFGVVAASEAVFPNARFPYASHTLACAFASAFVSWRAGAIAAAVSFLAFASLRSHSTALIEAFQVAVTVALVSQAFRFRRWRLLAVTIATIAAQSICTAAASAFGTSSPSLESPWTIPANVFGVLLLALVLHDARVRSDVVRQKQEATESRRVAAEAEFVALRTRVQPHFLYNALTSIAALCDIEPRRARRAAIQLGSLMRKSLETDLGLPHSLAEELDLVRSYTDIESERFGPRIKVEVDANGCDGTEVPMFSVQILVENAILHGVSRIQRQGVVTVCARNCGKFTLIAVSDNGPGLPPGGWRQSTPHGLTILEAQLQAQGGDLKLLRRQSGGTLAVIKVTRREGGRK